MKKNKYLNILIFHSSLLILIVSFLLSCQTMPKAQDTFLEDIKILPLGSGASAYIFANAQKARDILELLPLEELKDPQTKQMMDRTGYFVAALFPPETGKRFQLAAWGNYPNVQAGFAFTFDKNWKKQRSQAGGSYWYSSVSGLSLSIDSKKALAASSLTAQPFDLLDNKGGAQVPEGFNEFRGNADLSCWLVNPGDTITRMLSEAGLPIRFPVLQLFFNLITVSPGRYEAVIRLQFDNPTQARGMAAVINLASSFGLAGSNFIASLFISNPSSQSENNLDFFTNILSDQEIITLFNLFLSV